MKLKTEAHFDIRITVPASKLGPFLALLDNRYDVNGVHLIKELAPGKNITRGGMRQAIADAINASGGAVSKSKLYPHLVSLGFTLSSAHTQVRRYAKEGYFVIEKGATGNVRLGKKKV